MRDDGIQPSLLKVIDVNSFKIRRLPAKTSEKGDKGGIVWFWLSPSFVFLFKRKTFYFSIFGCWYKVGGKTLTPNSCLYERSLSSQLKSKLLCFAPEKSWLMKRSWLNKILNWIWTVRKNVIILSLPENLFPKKTLIVVEQVIRVKLKDSTIVYLSLSSLWFGKTKKEELVLCFPLSKVSEVLLLAQHVTRLCAMSSEFYWKIKT